VLIAEIFQVVKPFALQMLRGLRNFGRVIFQDENILLEILQECKILKLFVGV